jgi:nucleoside-diphosphate-sugar epimerase
MNSQILSKIKVLIVGCGDIGERLAMLLPSNHEITGLRRNPPTKSSRIDYETCDVTDPSQVDTVIGKHNADVIVITMTPSERSDSGYERAYVQTCNNVVASLNAHNRKPQLLLFVSSTGVYGQNDGSWVNEDSPTLPETFSGKRLLEAENVIRESKFNHVIVRFSGIYGPGRNRLIDAVREGRASQSSHYTNRIHVDDCASALWHFIDLDQRGKTLKNIYVVSDSAPIPMKEVINWLAAQMGIENLETNSTSPQEGGNKQCSNLLLLSSGYRLLYPSYKEGYSALL